VLSCSASTSHSSQSNCCRLLVLLSAELPACQRGVRCRLGALASEEGRLEEARLLLRRAVVADAPDAHAQANALVALGIAALRDNDPEAAQGPLEKAVVLEPCSPVCTAHPRPAAPDEGRCAGCPAPPASGSDGGA